MGEGPLAGMRSLVVEDEFLLALDAAASLEAAGAQVVGPVYDVERAVVLSETEQLGAAMLGLSGSLFALTEGTISPTTYGFAQVDVETMVMLAFGGIGTLFGPVLGAAIFTVIDELIQDLGQLRLLVYGALIIALFLWVPRGVIPTLGDLTRRRRK